MRKCFLSSSGKGYWRLSETLGTQAGMTNQCRSACCGGVGAGGTKPPATGFMFLLYLD